MNNQAAQAGPGPGPGSQPQDQTGALDTRTPLIVLLGPTAVGKTELSLVLGERLEAEIVSADSRLFYRGMDIGTAKPTVQDRARVPHHLVDVADPDETWSLSLFQLAAQEAIAGIQARGRTALLVGGSGQYIHAIVHGWTPPAIAPDPQLRRELERRAASEGPHALHADLSRLDPQAALSIDPRNVRRTIRALEVIRLTGRQFSAQRRQTGSAYRVLMVGLTRPRPELYARVDARIELMFAEGLLEEVRTLLASGYSPDLSCMSSIGYRECILVLQGRMSVDAAKVEMRRLTRNFVRRQANWFKADDPSIHWFDAAPASLAGIESLARAFLEESKLS